MNFEDFLGMSALTGRLRADMNEGGHMVHAYLFVGPRGTGKRALAAICVRALNCEGTFKPCDLCPPCQRSLAGTHPDLIRIDEQKSITVDEVRALIARVMVRPFEGGRHAVIIERAERMTPQAQNALLKTLESPPDSAVFFLTAESESALLPTVRSRCRIFRFHQIDEAPLVQALLARGIEPVRASQLARQADGSVGRALALDGDKAYWELRERVLRALESLRDPSNVGEVSEALKADKDSAEAVLGIFEGVGRERMQRGAPNGGISGERMLQGVFDARARLASNVVWHNVLESLFFSWMDNDIP